MTAQTAISAGLIGGALAVLYGIALTFWVLAHRPGTRACARSLPHPRGRDGLPPAPVSHDRYRRDRACDCYPFRSHARQGSCCRLFDRRDSFGRGGIYRHDCLGARERSYGRSSARRARTGAERRVPRRLGHRHAGRRFGPARGLRLLRHSLRFNDGDATIRSMRWSDSRLGAH